MIKDEFSGVKGAWNRFELRRKKLGLCRKADCTEKSVAYGRCFKHGEKIATYMHNYYGYKNKSENTKLRRTKIN
jgi:hypothetical protein